MCDINKRRVPSRGKVWIRQHPVHEHESIDQDARNEIVVNSIKHYMMNLLDSGAANMANK